MIQAEAFLVAVGVDEPVGDAVGAVAGGFAGLGFEDIDAVDFDPELAVILWEQGDVWLAEDDEEVALAGVFEVFSDVEVGIHAGLEDRDAA